jgi:plastocyanin domain-containing protein
VKSLVACLAFLGGAGAAFAEPQPRHIDIAITKHGFDPDRITVAKDQAVELAFTRKTDATCAKQITLELGDGTKVSKDLPLDHAVVVPVTFHKAGELHYACSMDMVRGVVVVQ